MVRILFAFCLAAILGAQDTTVVLVRHAERQSILDADSPLAAAGFRRAQALAPVLAAFRPVALYTSNLQRTRQTLAPLAARLGMTPTAFPKGDSAGLAAAILRDHRGRLVVVCWHHDLMKKVVRALGVTGAVPHWSWDDYDPLWIVRVPAQGAATLSVRSQRDLGKGSALAPTGTEGPPPGRP
jgi:2,3-bisphosphoglycerate-dependent phosphoglycerate mutase